MIQAEERTFLSHLPFLHPVVLLLHKMTAFGSFDPQAKCLWNYVISFAIRNFRLPNLDEEIRRLEQPLIRITSRKFLP